MSKSIKLSNAVKYSNKRINVDDISVADFVSTDNLLQNKLGKTNAIKLPALKGLMPGYRNEDILVGNIRPYLRKIWFADKESGCSADVLVFEVNKFKHPKFIYYTLFRDDFFDHMMKGSKGTKMPRGDKKQILDFLIPDFKFEEQQKIAKVLSDLDAKIEINNRINSELEAMAKTLYDYWFVQFDFPHVTSSGVEKPYKSSGGKMVWNAELKREIPEGWKVKTLLDIATFVNGLACQKFRPNDNEESYRVIKIREMGTGFTENSEFVSINIPEKVVIQNGDILFSWSATLDVKIWTGGTGALNQHIFKVTSNDFPKSYFYFELLNYLQHFKMQAELRKTTMGHITQDHLRQSRITIPTLELIEKLDEILKPILDKKVKLEEENQELASLRDWLLPMLMNGQVSAGDVEALRQPQDDMLGMVAEPREIYKN